jgi:hypothetical protein
MTRAVVAAAVAVVSVTTVDVMRERETGTSAGSAALLRR